jgi:hypothetical protein
VKLTEIQKKAQTLGIKDTWKYAKKDLIRTIQKKEGNADCFKSGKSSCEQTACCWKGDCLK